MAGLNFDVTTKIQGSWALICRVLGAASVIGVNFILTRIMTSEDIGTYFLILSGCWALSLVMMWGLGQSLVRLIVEQKNRGEVVPIAISSGLTVLAAIYVLFVSMSQVSAVQSYWEILFKKEFSLLSIVLFSTWVFLQSLQNFVVETLRGYQKIIEASIFGMVPNLLFFICVILVYFFSGNALPRELIFIMSTLTALNIIAVLRFNAELFFPLVQPTWNEFKRILFFSSPFFATTVVLYFSTQADLWIVGAYMDNNDVAIYGLALRVTLLLPFILGVVNSTVQPKITDYYGKGKLCDLEIHLRKTATVALLPAALIFIGVVLWGESGFAFAFGQDFSGAYRIFLILGLGYLVHVWAGSPGYVLLMTKHEVLFLTIVACSTIFSVVCAISMIGRYGVWGVAIGSALGLSAQSILSLLVVKSRLGIWTYSTINFR